MMVSIVITVIGVIGSIVKVYFVYKYLKKHGLPTININMNPLAKLFYTTVANSQIENTTIEDFLNEMAREKPIRFSSYQLASFTQNYATKLGSGGFGDVYKGILPNGVLVAVKKLHGCLDKRVEEQFMAEVSTIGRTYHINLVRLFGFCFDANVRALVYEYMQNGALDKLLFKNSTTRGDVNFGMLHEIAIGIAKGIRYLHEECQQKIIHYDIKPGNVLLDDKYIPKVADFGLAKLLSRDKTHASMTGMRGTPGYAAPEMWMATRVTQKCDVYSFGMLLFEIAGRRNNFVEVSSDNGADSEQWFPQKVWEKCNNNQLAELLSDLHGMTNDEEIDKAGRMCKVALWCAQYQPEARPPISKVVKMLEGEMDINPPANPFQHLTLWVVDYDLQGQASTHSPSSREIEPLRMMRSNDYKWQRTQIRFVTLRTYPFLVN